MFLSQSNPERAGRLVKCYKHADNETLLEVMTHSKKISEAASLS